MKMRTSVAGGLLGSMLLLSPVFAADYSMMTTEELSRMRGGMQDAPIEERQAFQNEWQQRVRTMTQEEKRRYLERPEGAEESRERERKREGFQEDRIKRGIESGGAGPRRMGNGRGGR
ncbi:MAG: DUF1104 domain-containing protein [Nitrospirota bacterium]